MFLARNGTSLNERTIRKLVKKYYDSAGVRKRGVHTLRHTLCAHKIANKMSSATLQKLMGHNWKETTLKCVHIAHTNIKQEQIDTAL